MTTKLFSRQLPVVVFVIALVACVLWLMSRASMADNNHLKMERRFDRPSAIRDQQSESPCINLRGARDLPAVYTGALGLQQALERGSVQPRALASGDFDEDGVPDLISSYVAPHGGLITLHRGNLYSIYPNHRDPRPRTQDSRPFTQSAIRNPQSAVEAPFLPEARVFELPEAPDFLGAGDFDADGHWDVVTAAAGSTTLRWLAGDGLGGFDLVQSITLPGAVTAMVIGEINRADGLADVAVGINGPNGSEVLVFEGPEGAFGKDERKNSFQPSPVVLPMPGAVTALALGQLDDSFEMDLAVAAGSELVIVHGRDRPLSLDEIRQAEVQPAVIEQQSFPFEITSIALGDFAWDDQHRTEIAILANDGTIYLIEDRGSKIEARPWGHRSTSVGVTAPQLVRAKVSSTPTDDLIVLDAANHQLHILTRDHGPRTTDSRLLAASGQRLATLDAEGEPVAVLPMRLNADALNDLVILRAGSSTPTVAMTAALATVTVNSATNVADGDTSSISNLMMTPGPDTFISLREAITAANNTAGADMISFNIPGAGVHTITTAPGGLPAITGAVTIDGYTQPGSSANTNPLNAGINAVLLIELNQTSAAGLTINAAGTTIRGLVLNRGSSDEITVAASNATIAGNFIGTNPAGTAGASGGFSIRQTSGNNTIIGGPTAADRNLISGKVSGGIIVQTGDGTLIQGNYIGTDVTGTVALNNSGSSQAGVIILGGVFFLTTNTVISGNLISGNRGGGMDISSDGGGLIQGNLIGTQRDGVGALGNGGGGVLLRGTGSGFVVGGTSPGQGNTIAFNQVQGIGVSASTFGSGILGNSIHSNMDVSNAGLGINLRGTAFLGPLANDPCDTDGGPGNRGQNYPVLTSVPVAAGNVTISGTLNSTASTTFRIEFFSNVICDPSGNGEGQTFLGFANVTTDPTCNASFGPLVFPVPPGQTIFTATATDPANNTSEFSQCSPVAAGCTITCPQNQTVNTGPGSTQCGATVQYPAPTTGGSCGTVTCTPSSGSFFAKGTTTVNCTTSSGPSCSFTVTVADNTPPTITCPANTTTSTSASCAVVNYPAPAVSDNCAGATSSCSPPSGACFPLGTTTVNCTATDASGNQASCSFTVTVNQTTCTCPQNQTVNTGPGSTQCGASVQYPAPTGGSCGTGTCTPSSGSFFAKGTTTVNCTTSSGPSCSFTVTVADNTPPTITCPANTTTSTSASCAVVNYPSPAVSDNCSGATASCSPASGTCFPLGTTPVNCTAADASGNQASCGFTVTVNQTTCTIAITCPANQMAVTDQNVCASPACQVVNYPAAYANCPGVSVVCNPPAGSCFPTGKTTVTCTATDKSGNTAACTFKVTTFDVALQDDSDPSIILLWNSITGEYRFCCNGITFTGVGKATRKGCVYTLEHNPADRRVLGRVDKAVRVGSGAIQAPAGTIRCTITDRNTLNDTLLPACQ